MSHHRSDPDVRQSLASRCLALIGRTLACAAMAVPTFGQSNGVQSEVNGYYGTFGTSVPIAVPAFHGLEPKIALNYGSGSGDSWVGVGWSLQGISYIERAQPGGGAPQYSGNDGFFLEGVELVPYTGLGGTHATKLMNYARITLNTTSDSWTVVGTNGNIATYTRQAPSFSLPAFRWVLRTVSDSNGNVVTYNYTTESPWNVVISSITYNGNTINFLPEEPSFIGRPDPFSYSTGQLWGRVNTRLGAIEVVSAGQRARVYDLTYVTSPVTSRSLLASVRQYDRNATIGASGVSGNSLPAMSMTYHAPSINLIYNPSNSVPGFGTDSRTWVADFTGDGMADIGSAAGQGVYVKTSNGVGFFSSWWLTGTFNVGNHPSDQIWPGDLNADGRTDLLVRVSPTSLVAYISTGTGFISQSFTTPNSWGPMSETWTGDFNGDDRMDIASRSGVTVWVRLATADPLGALNGFNLQAWASPGTWGPIDRVRLGDFDGDGRTDIASPASNGQSILVSRSTGTGFAVSTWSSLGVSSSHWSRPEWIRVGDFNADGLTDFCTFFQFASPVVQTQINFHFSNGSNGFDFHSGNAPFYFEHPASTWTGDFNGDNQADILARFDSGSTMRFLLTREKGQSLDIRPPVSDPSPWGPREFRRIGDYNGDGRMDMASPTPSAASIALRYSSGEPADYLYQVDNGIGSTSVVSYWPSSQWTNHYMPSGMIVHAVRSLQTNLGGLPIGTTEYTYSGGKYSAEAKRFLGFEWVTAVLNQGHTTRTQYLQDPAAISKPRKTSFTAVNQKYTESEFVYNTSAAAPYTSLLQEKFDDVYNTTANSRRVRTAYGYDIHGNVTSVLEDGDIAVTGDERLTVRSYVANTGNYLSGLPAYEIVYDGSTTAAPIVSAGLFYYDGSTNYQSPPIKGNLTRVDKWLDITSSWVSTSLGYDANGNVTSETDERGFTATTTYDPVQNIYPISVTNALQRTISRTWDPVLGVELTMTDPNGAVTTTTYDTFGRLATVTYPDSSVSTTQYLDWGIPTSRRVRQSDPDGTSDGLWTEHYIDGIGRTYRIVKEGLSPASPVRIDTEFWFGTDRIRRQTNPYRPGDPILWTQYGYDLAGRPSYTIFPDGAYVQVAYGMDSNNKPYEEHTRQLTAGANPILQITRVWYDAYGKLTRVREQLNGQFFDTDYTYDALNRLVQVTDAQQHTSLFLYDSLGRKVVSLDADMGFWITLHDAAGNQVLQQDAKGQVLTFTYDQLNRMVSKVYPDGSQCTWGYDAPAHGSSIGRLTSVTSPSATADYSYNNRGLLTNVSHVVNGVSRSRTQTYDSMGRIASTTYPDGEVVVQSYDNEGRVQAATGLIQQMSWNAAGQLTNLQYVNGTQSTYTYDPNRLWLNTSQVRRGTTLLHDSTYTYDLGARMQTVSSTTNPLRNKTFVYDSLNRLTAVTGSMAESFSYDSIGNMTFNSNVGTYAYNGAQAHAPSAVNGVPMSYDGNGNLTDDGNRIFTWDFDNRLVAMSDEAQGLDLQFEYGADGSRVSKDSADLFFGDYASIEQGAPTQHYVVGGMRIAKKVAGVKEFLHSDQLGSVVLTTNATGQTASVVDYSAFGMGVSGGSAPSPFTFNGHRQDSSDLIFMQSRYYDPVLGRFLQPDSIVPDPRNPQALNRYAFAYNNPVANSDPTGHAPVAAAIIAATIVSAQATTTIVVVAWIGAGLSVAGYFAQDPYLAAAGGILLGFAGGWVGPTPGWGGGLVGAAASAATSSLSPLDDDAKQAVGWAFTAVGAISNGDNLVSTALNKAYRTYSHVGVNKILAHYGIDPGEFTVALTVVSFAGNELMGSRLSETKDGVEIQGMWNRDGIAGFGFDIADVALAWQGLPTATAYEYMFSASHGTMLIGHSLGALDANNLAGWNIPQAGTNVWSLPFFAAAAPGVTNVINGRGDFVNLWSAGVVFSPTCDFKEGGHNFSSYYSHWVRNGRR